MFKPMPSLTKSAERRLQKVAIKRLRMAKIQRAEFLAQVRTTEPTAEALRAANLLVERVRVAQSADFLQQYRS